TTRSLNEFDGLTESSLIQSVSRPRRAARFLARRSGVNPAPRSIRSRPGPPGSSDSYRHSVRGPDSACLRNTSPSIDCRSYVGSSGPKHSSQIVSGSTAYCWPHSRHCNAWGDVILTVIGSSRHGPVIGGPDQLRVLGERAARV